MNPGCPNLKCIHYQNSTFVIKDGSYFRHDDSRSIHRFKCKACGKRFSSSTSTLEWRHKKRRVNFPLFKLLASGVSMRRAAILLNVHRVTVERKFVYLAKKAELSQRELIERLRMNPVQILQFDDLITSEHTKLKPLSVSVAVDKKRRFILGLKVSQIPSFGHLSKLSRIKYGKRPSNHLEKLTELLSEIKPTLATKLVIETDEHKRYPEVLQRIIPWGEHRQYKSARACVVGQGELKKLHRDPLFKINHTCAMLRANVDRIFRRTWCTTKQKEKLEMHLMIFTQFYNQILLKENYLEI